MFGGGVEDEGWKDLFKKVFTKPAPMPRQVGRVYALHLAGADPSFVPPWRD